MSAERCIDAAWRWRRPTPVAVFARIGSILFALVLLDAIGPQLLATPASARPPLLPLEYKVEIYVRGIGASQTLAQVYLFLNTKHPELLGDLEAFNRIENVSERGWDAALRLGVWPRHANQIEQFIETFRVSGSDNSTYVFAFPPLTTTTSLSIEVTELSFEDFASFSNDYQTDSSEQKFCRMHEWVDLGIDKLVPGEALFDTRENCIIKKIPPRNYPGLKPTNPQVVFVRPAYVIVLPVELPQTDINRLNAELAAFFKPQPTGSALYSASFQRATSNFEENWGDSVSTPCVAASLPSIPSMPDNDEERRVAILDNLAAIRAGELPKSLPSNGAIPASIECEDILGSPPPSDDFPNHAFGLAHLLASDPVRLKGKPVTTGLLSRVEITYLPFDAIEESKRTPWHKKRYEFVLLVAGAEKGLSVESNDALSSYIRNAQNVGAPIVISAPEIDLGEDHPPYIPASIENQGRVQSYETCAELPACLGQLPFAIVVGPSDQNGEIWHREQYRLGSSVVGITALGNDALVRVPTGEMARASGSSISAAVVAAMLAEMQARTVGVAADLLVARALATSDLGFFDVPDGENLVRFGNLNVDRALAGVPSKAGLDTIWSIEREFDGSYAESNVKPRFAYVEATSLSASLGDCGDPESTGVVRLFDPDKFYYVEGGDPKPLCKPLSNVLRIRPSKIAWRSDGTPVPLFTVVYVDDFSPSISSNNEDPIRIFSDSNTPIYAVVMSDVAFRPRLTDEYIHSQDRLGCDETGDIVEAFTLGACLYVGDEGSARPLDMTRSDIVFSLDNLGEVPKLPCIPGWESSESDCEIGND